MGRSNQPIPRPAETTRSSENGVHSSIDARRIREWPGGRWEVMPFVRGITVV